MWVGRGEETGEGTVGEVCGGQVPKEEVGEDGTREVERGEVWRVGGVPSVG